MSIQWAIRVIGGAAACVVAASGCYKVDTEPFTNFDAAGHDAPADAIQLACEADTIVCDDATDRYIECDSEGVATRVIDCPLGCYELAKKCVDIDPSNGLASHLDIARSDPTVPSIAFTGASTINTITGDTTIDGDPVTIPSEIVGNVRVFLFKELSIGGTVKVTGPSHMIAFVVDGDFTMTGTLDVSADGPTPGPGGGLTDDDPCAGDGPVLPGSSTGAGGAGHYDVGGKGGATYDGSPGYDGGAMIRDADLAPLRPGCRGGSISALISGPKGTMSYYSIGGGGGGAVQIVSSSRITMTGIAKIDASGGGGSTNETYDLAGGGGGSGGGVLLEAPAIILDGAGVVVSTKGGGGAAGGNDQATHDGADGGTGPAPAAGGMAAPNAAGGAGGTESASPSPGAAGPSGGYARGGGGGGSVGEARFNTESATVAPSNGAAIRSRFSVSSIGTRLIP